MLSLPEAVRVSISIRGRAMFPLRQEQKLIFCSVMQDFITVPAGNLLKNIQQFLLILKLLQILNFLFMTELKEQIFLQKAALFTSQAEY